MKDRESRSAEREARRDSSVHPERPAKHEEDVRRYLASEFYTERNARSGRASDRPKKRVDRQ